MKRLILLLFVTLMLLSCSIKPQYKIVTEVWTNDLYYVSIETVNVITDVDSLYMLTGIYIMENMQYLRYNNTIEFTTKTAGKYGSATWNTGNVISINMH